MQDSEAWDLFSCLLYLRDPPPPPPPCALDQTNRASIGSDKMKLIVKKLCSRDPHQFFQRLETLARSVLVYYYVLLVTRTVIYCYTTFLHEVMWLINLKIAYAYTFAHPKLAYVYCTPVFLHVFLVVLASRSQVAYTCVTYTCTCML